MLVRKQRRNTLEHPLSKQYRNYHADPMLENVGKTSTKWLEILKKNHCFVTFHPTHTKFACQTHVRCKTTDRPLLYDCIQKQTSKKSFGKLVLFLCKKYKLTLFIDFLDLSCQIEYYCIYFLIYLTSSFK